MKGNNDHEPSRSYTMTGTIHPTPSSTALEQRRAALRSANRTRKWRADIKHDVAAGDVAAADVLTSRPVHAIGMRVDVLLLSVSHVGALKTAKVLHDLGVEPSKTIGALSDRQRAALIEWLDGR